MKLNDILTSGFTFERDDYGLRLRYLLFNSFLLFNIFVVGFAAIMRFINLQYFQGIVDIIYILLGIVALVLARRSLAYFETLIYFVIVFSFLVVIFSFKYGLNPIVGISWYFIFIMTVFFLKGVKIGTIAFFIAIVSIIVISLQRNIYNFAEISLGIIPFIAGYIFMLFFEQRNKEFKTLMEAQKKELAYKAQYDGLTGVANRELFFDRLDQALKFAKRSNLKVAVFFIDLDHFKEINDSLGHYTGDEVLKEVALRLQTQIRESDTFARLGGDEYAIIINALDSTEMVDSVIQKLFNIMKEPIKIENNELYISLSLGITIYPDDAQTRDSLLKNADVAMYYSKGKGRNTYSFYSEK